MALYIGNSEKMKLYLGDSLKHLNIFSTILITNGARLLSSDNFILKDSNGAYLTAKKEDDE